MTTSVSRLRAWIMQRWRWTLPAGVVTLAVVAWLAFGFFGVHTLFFDDEVAEEVPVFASGAGASTMPSDSMPDELVDEINAAMEQEGTSMVDEASEDMPDMDSPMTETPEIETLIEGSFISRSHPAEGSAVVLNDGTEQRFLRFEDFVTDNGPDLNVYLSAAPADASASDFDDDFVDLGDLKGNIGPQNYEIPVDVDLQRYSTVVIWCVRFGVAFAAADLAAL